MSYCRFSEGDVYAYACEGGVQFWVVGKTFDRLCETYDAAYQYAKHLRDEGLDVPSHAIEALRADALDEASHGDGSVVAELVSENAKLREENKSLRTVAVRYYTELLHSDDVLGQIMARKKLQELGIEVDDG